ncbi:16S rRNA (guanine(966)-N(2))-methyltransferase RsmD [Nostocoides veronense]|uniref:16S rRNA (Guanine(966)-N(2))-methyltransferase RsmD n=1 Tax=Nostocoides veronense TaxID=330836 RepID=A0ABN2LXV5_9MICO
MTRIIGGRFGGRLVRAPKGSATRPTSDRVRESLFSRLDAWDAIEGLAVLDVYAGSGALGLEAASRGAARVDLVEADAKAAAVIRGNVTALGLSALGLGGGGPAAGGTQVQVHACTVRAFAGRLPPAGADLVLGDPPYPLGEEDLAGDLAALAAGGWIAPDALLVIERSSRSPEPAWPAGIEGVDEKKYGETRLWFARAGSGADKFGP